jgi:hypothetical protein
MEKPPPHGSVAFADTQAIPANLLADKTADDAGEPSRRAGRAAAYASLSGEQGAGEILAASPRVGPVGDTSRYDGMSP